MSMYICIFGKGFEKTNTILKTIQKTIGETIGETIAETI